MYQSLVRRAAPLQASSAIIAARAQRAQAVRGGHSKKKLAVRSSREPITATACTQSKRRYKSGEDFEGSKGGCTTSSSCTPLLDQGLSVVCSWRVEARGQGGGGDKAGPRPRGYEPASPGRSGYVGAGRAGRHGERQRSLGSSHDGLLRSIASSSSSSSRPAVIPAAKKNICSGSKRWASTTAEAAEGGGGERGGAEAEAEEEEDRTEGAAAIDDVDKENRRVQGKATTDDGATPSTPAVKPAPTPAPAEETFRGNFTQQEPIPEEGIDAALAVLRSGRLHRYNTAPGETSQTALLEQEFAASTGARFCVAVASGGYAMSTALRAVGVQPGDAVLSNAFTLAPVPGAIAAVGADPIFVGVTESLTIDIDDLEAKIAAAAAGAATAPDSNGTGGGGDGRPGARVLLLSHMRGHICDMDRLMEVCAAAGVVVVEDCAHTMGAAWKGVPSGRHGAIGCFSCQTYKHVNSGEGGFLITDDEELAAKAIMMSGSYMLYDRHLAAPGPEVFERLKYVTPNVSGRMDNLRAAILRPQLRDLDEQVARWNSRYGVIERGLRGTPGLQLCDRADAERFVGSSFQFLLLGWSAPSVERVLQRCAARGVELKWFGAPEPIAFTSRYDSWRYAASEPMPATDAILAGIMDMRVPLTFSLEDCAMIARIVRAEVSKVVGGGGV